MTITVNTTVGTGLFQFHTTGSGESHDITNVSWAAGDVLVALVDWENVGSTFTATTPEGAMTVHAIGGTTDPWAGVSSLRMASAGTNQTITFGFDASGNTNYKDISLFVVKGNFDASYFDGAGKFDGDSSSITSAVSSSFGTTDTGIVLVGAKAYNSVTWTPEGDLTAVTGPSAFQGLAYKIAATGGPRTVTMSTSGGTRIRIAAIALKEAAGGQAARLIGGWGM